MSTTYATLRQNILKLFHASRMVTATSIGAAAGASYISTDLKKWDGGNDDHYNEQWIRTTSGATQEDRFILDYATATGTITPVPAFSAQIANLVTAEVMPWEPASVLDAVQRAIDQCYPQPEVKRKGLFRSLFEEMVTNSWVWNGNFRDWTLTTIPDHWVKSGTATVSEETTIIRGPVGSSAVKMTGGGATDYIYQSQVEVPGLLDLKSQTVTFYVWAYAAAASACGITVAYKVASDAALTVATPTYHSGNSEFELLSIEVTLPAAITDFQVRLLSGGGTVYFANLYDTGGPYLYRYHMSKDFVHDPQGVEVQINDGQTYGVDMISGGEAWEGLPRGRWHIEDDGTNRLLVIHQASEYTGEGYSETYNGQTQTMPLQSSESPSMPYVNVYRRKLRIIGHEALSSPTTDASTVEVEGDQMRTLVILAAAELASSIVATLPVGPERDAYKANQKEFAAKGEDMLALFGKPLPMMNINLRIS